jgi:hypothetical protein
VSTTGSTRHVADAMSSIQPRPCSSSRVTAARPSSTLRESPAPHGSSRMPSSMARDRQESIDGVLAALQHMHA